METLIPPDIWQFVVQTPEGRMIEGTVATLLGYQAVMKYVGKQLIKNGILARQVSSIKIGIIGVVQ